jgi:hypothetical protein
VFGVPPSATFTGSGNLPPPPPTSVKAKTTPTRPQLLAKALHLCRTKYKHSRHRRASCERKARRHYAPARKARRTAVRRS